MTGKRRMQNNMGGLPPFDGGTASGTCCGGPDRPEPRSQGPPYRSFAEKPFGPSGELGPRPPGLDFEAGAKFDQRAK
eukprot:2521736-Alexandrium_andersonii.AAC.1